MSNDNKALITRILTAEKVVAVYAPNLPPISQEINEIWYLCSDHKKEYLLSSAGYLCPLEQRLPERVDHKWCHDYFIGSPYRETVFNDDFSKLFYIKLHHQYNLRFFRL